MSTVDDDDDDDGQQMDLVMGSRWRAGGEGWIGVFQMMLCDGCWEGKEQILNFGSSGTNSRGNERGCVLYSALF